jgi:hypothetical protein
MPHMNFTVHTDPGHSWLFVSHLQLRTLGLSTKSFTPYSFTDEFGVYAEEDLDAGVVLRAYRAMFDSDPKIDFVDYTADAPCRRLPRCAGDADKIAAAFT